MTLSSGEAELRGVVQGGANGLGFLSLLGEYHIKLKLRLWTDSSASKGMCARQGLGKVRHLDVQDVWIQQRLRNGDFSLYKIKGDDNPGDLFTKASLTYARIETLLTMLGCIYQEGRPESAPALRHKGTERKILEVEKRPRWSDENDSDNEEDSNYHGRVIGGKAAIELLKRVGFPHTRARDYRREQARDPYPELPECRDPMSDLGESIGRDNRGRSSLPQMKISRLRGSKDGCGPYESYGLSS